MPKFIPNNKGVIRTEENKKKISETLKRKGIKPPRCPVENKRIEERSVAIYSSDGLDRSNKVEECRKQGEIAESILQLEDVASMIQSEIIEVRSSLSPILRQFNIENDKRCTVGFDTELASRIKSITERLLESFNEMRFIKDNHQL